MTTAAWKKRDVTLQRLKVAMRNSFGMAATTTGIELSIPFGTCARKYDANFKDNKTEEFAGAHAALGPRGEGPASAQSGVDGPAAFPIRSVHG